MARGEPTKSALFVRLPAEVMASVDELVRTTGRTKQAVVTGMVEHAITGNGSAGTSASAEVLNLAEAAELLRVKPEQVIDEVQKSSLPGRRLGEDWRFSREALMQWLAEPQRNATSPGSSPRKPGFAR